LDGWLKENERGKWLSLTAKPTDEQPAKPKPAGASSFDKPIDDGIPF